MRVLPVVDPSPEQIAILKDSNAGFRLIRGAAGSGKTTTSLMRLRQLVAARRVRRLRLGLDEPVRVLVLTYNRTLEGYVGELARNQVGTADGLELEVSTFSRWARSLVDDVDILDHSGAAGLLRRELAPIGGDKQLTDFYISEVDYALSRFLPEDLGDYLTVKREGRGLAPRVDRTLREKILYEVVPAYEAEKQRRGALDWNDLALEAMDVPTWGYDIVVVDEAQDFSANQVRCVLAHLAPEHSTTFVIDAVQRIYPRCFNWPEVGIDLRRANTWQLTENLRNTAEIAAFARALVEDLPLEDDGTLPDFHSCEASGQLPVVVSGRFSDQMDFMISWIEDNVDLEEETVAILHPKGGKWFSYVEQRLEQAGLGYCDLTRLNRWPKGPEQIGLSTIHSAKGLEFDHVLLPGLNQQVTPHGADSGDDALQQLRRLLAMAIGRARETVVLGYKPGEESSLVSLLDPSTYQLVEM
jgi:superfamily I DNA/RNA helicase